MTNKQKLGLVLLLPAISFIVTLVIYIFIALPIMAALNGKWVWLLLELFFIMTIVGLDMLISYNGD